MAKINIDIDTSKKTVAVKVDDKKVPDVHDVHVFTEISGFFGVDIAQVEDLGDLKKITRLVASKEGDPKIIVKTIEKSQDYLRKVSFSKYPQDGDLHKFELLSKTVDLLNLVE